TTALPGIDPDRGAVGGNGSAPSALVESGPAKKRRRVPSHTPDAALSTTMGLEPSVVATVPVTEAGGAASLPPALSAVVGAGPVTAPVALAPAVPAAPLLVPTPAFAAAPSVTALVVPPMMVTEPVASTPSIHSPHASSVANISSANGVASLANATVVPVANTTAPKLNSIAMGDTSALKAMAPEPGVGGAVAPEAGSSAGDSAAEGAE
ncbi:unnamed protein product, partial [Discosporangium mesarthrocarpum]